MATGMPGLAIMKTGGGRNLEKTRRRDKEDERIAKPSIIDRTTEGEREDRKGGMERKNGKWLHRHFDRCIRAPPGWR